MTMMMRLVHVWFILTPTFLARCVAVSASSPYQASLAVPQQQFFAISDDFADHDAESSTSTTTTPRLRLEDMALALRWTGELNRRLQSCAKSRRNKENNVPLMLQNHQSLLSHHNNEQPAQVDVLRGGQQQQMDAYRVPSLLSQKDSLVAESKPPLGLTIFHAKTPRPQKPGSALSRRGAARWGPDLSKYLKTLVGLLEIEDAEEDSDSNQILALAMIYLDRSCSVDIPRSNGLPPCPFLTPRTAHRLVLSALLVALETVRGTTANANDANVALYSKVSAGLGIPVGQLHQMVDWMRGALGDPGLFVAPYQVADFAQTWSLRFGAGSATTTTSSIQDNAAASSSPPRKLVPPRPAFVNPAATVAAAA